MNIKKKIIFSVLAGLVIVLAGIFFWLFQSGGLVGLADTIGVGKAHAYSLFGDYYLYEPVTFGIRNDGRDNITLKNSAPWYVQNEGGKKIFVPSSMQMVSELRPGEYKEWSWNQKNNQGSQASPGKYKVVVKYQAASLAATSFNITKQIGSSGYFTFGIGSSETLRVYMQKPQSIRAAIDHYYKKNRQGIPNGLLIDDRPGKSLYDAQWSWHLDPADIVMAEATIEVCDGLPSYVEENLDYWLERVKRYCPWGAQIKSLN